LKKFNNGRIALLEARMSGEMAGLIKRYGGQPYSVPAVREVPVDSSAQVATFIDHLVEQRLRVVVCFTGVGVTALFREAERLGRLPTLLEILQKTTVVCRGPKPVAVLKRYQIPIAASAQEPHTTNELLEVLRPLDLQGKGVGIVHYGERNAQVIEALQQKGAYAEELCLYEWQLPEDITPLQTLVRELLAQNVAAVVFTSQVQVRHLFQIATDLHASQELIQALNNKTIVASVGPTCTGVLYNFGVTPDVEPEHPKMGHLVKALFEYIHTSSSP